MSSIIPFTAGAQLPAYLKNKAALEAINKEVTTGASFTTLSIKGKVFTLVRDSERKVMTRADDADEVLQSLTLTAVRANKDGRTFYALAYDEEESKAARPTCFSYDGVTPDTQARDPQATKCATCKQNIWGDTPNGKGTACSQNTRLAVVDTENIGEPMLLRVPPASRTAFNDTVKAAIARGIPYNALALKVSFDTTAATPKLVFKITGLVNDASYDKISALFDSELVGDIIGRASEKSTTLALAAPADSAEAELDAAIAASAVAAVAKAKPAPVKAVVKAVPKPTLEDAYDEVEPAAEPVKAAKPAVKAVAKAVASNTEDDDLLADLDSLLADTDD